LDGTSTITGGNNLIKIAGATLTLPPDTITDDPQLGPLAYNGGETRTHAIPATSPAHDVGNNVAGGFYDQRGPGYAREVGSAPDIGAYELNPDIIFISGFD
ncbi:MAG TPA: choice-of-anchor Q domain-containing protein, partial [Rhodanobacteraceae bacterium]